MKITNFGRRAFVRNAGALSALGLASRFDLLNLVATANAQAVSDYKALVCGFMFGGNDGNNTVIPIDSAGYAQYASARSVASGINLAQASLLPIQPINLGTPFGLHPSLVELQTLFSQKKWRFLPTWEHWYSRSPRRSTPPACGPSRCIPTRISRLNGRAGSRVAAGTGWGGRIADKLAPLNAASGFPVVTSLGGTVLFTTGASTAPLAVPSSGSFALSGFTGSAASNARLMAVQQLLAQSSSNAFVASDNAIAMQALQLSTTVNPILQSTNSTIASLFANLKTGTASQLYQVAKLIEARAATGAKRQIFFVQLGSFDTHSDQVNRQQALFAELSPALKAFYDATVSLGVSSAVTTFTLSDFGRTFLPASGGGTDHAWGSHHMIIGDAVKGGSMYGQYPQLIAGGPSDAESEGRWLPAASVDQYGATLARWFGVAPTDLAAVFSNVSQFPTADLGFMS